MLGKRFSSTLAATVLIAASGTAGAAANFDNDVSASIDLGLAWFDSAGCYGPPYNCGDATGLALLALLEKRPSAAASGQGYAGASDADKTRMRSTVRYIINQVDSQSNWYAYRDGAYLMALSVYMRTGGPDKDDGPTTELDGAPLTLKQTLDKVFDRLIAGQIKNQPDSALPYPATNGYWCYGTYYGSLDCRDSSTTQLVMGGMASARAVYLAGTYADATRLAALDAATVLARKAYERNGVAGDYESFYSYPENSGYGCGKLPNEKGHGYNAGDPNSIQQTASGLWIQLVGGAGPNWPDVQSYMRWLRNRYRWDNISANYFHASWSSSYWYYLWSSFKAYQFIADSKIPPSAGNIGLDDFGKLPEGSDPACAGRELHRDPDALPRVALFGAEGPGYYGDEDQRIYFDYAYTIMSYQCAGGNYNCNGAPSYWNLYAQNAYALLVLQRSVGGGCLDSDRDGICDADDPNVVEPPAPPPSGSLYCDKNGNGTVDQSDVLALMTLLKGKLSVPVNATTVWANYVNTGSQGTVINMQDYQACYLVWGNRMPKKYY